MLYRLMQDSRIEHAMHRDVVDDVIFFTVQSVPIGSFCVRSIWYSFFALHQYRALMRGSIHCANYLARKTVLSQRPRLHNGPLQEEPPDAERVVSPRGRC